MWLWIVLDQRRIQGDSKYPAFDALPLTRIEM